jgi:hypothetical protein
MYKLSALNNVYAADKAKFSNPADSTHQPTDPKNVPEWIGTVNAYASKVLGELIKKERGKGLKRKWEDGRSITGLSRAVAQIYYLVFPILWLLSSFVLHLPDYCLKHWETKKAMVLVGGFITPTVQIEGQPRSMVHLTAKSIVHSLQ